MAICILYFVSLYLYQFSFSYLIIYLIVWNVKIYFIVWNAV